MNEFIKGIFSGIAFLVLLAFVVVVGFLFYLANEIGLFDSHEKYHQQKYQEKYDKRLKWFNETKQNATSDNPDSEKVFLYAKYLKSKKAREYLKLKISEDESKTQANIYFQKARQLGSPSLKLDDARKSLGTKLNQSKKQQTKLLLIESDITIIESELNNVISVVKDTCHAHSIDSSYPFSKSQINTWFFDNIHPDIGQYPNIQYQIIAIQLKLNVHCVFSGKGKDELKDYMLDKEPKNKLSFQSDIQYLAYLSVFTELAHKDNIGKIISEDVKEHYPTEEQIFNNYRQGLATAYMDYFSDTIPKGAGIFN